MTKMLKAIGGWKTGAGIVGGAVTAVLLGLSWAQAPVEALDVRVSTVEASQAALSGDIQTVQDDLELVRCWVRHEINETDATTCLVNGNH